MSDKKEVRQIRQRELKSKERFKFIEYLLRDEDYNVNRALFEFGNFNKIYTHIRRQYEELANHSISRDFFILLVKYKVDKKIDEDETTYFFSEPAPFTVEDVCNSPTLSIRKQYQTKNKEEKNEEKSEEKSDDESPTE